MFPPVTAYCAVTPLTCNQTSPLTVLSPLTCKQASLVEPGTRMPCLLH